MNRKNALSILVTGLFLCTAGSLQAHEFILKPDTTSIRAGDRISVQVQAAHVFMVSEEAEPVEAVAVSLLQNGKSSDISLQEDPAVKALVGTVVVPDNGSAMLLGHRLPQIWSDTTEGVLQGNRQELETQGKKVVKVGKYEKFAKALLTPAAEDTLYSKVVGQPLEIVLLSNPAGLKAGDTIKVQVLAHGQGKKLPLGLTFDQYSKEEDTYLSEVETGEDGIATLTVTQPGLWMLRTALSEELSGQDADKHVMRATYVFPIR